MLWGSQDFQQTLAQVINAIAFGYLACTLMLFTGSIWFSVILRGLSDYSLVTTPAAIQTENLTARVDWPGIATIFGICSFIATLLLLTRNPPVVNRALRALGIEKHHLERFGLIETQIEVRNHE